MKRMRDTATGSRKLGAILLLAFVMTATHAGSLPSGAKIEIDLLLSSLKTANCEFGRNGSWYSAAEAQAHLNRKLKYLEDNGQVQTTEQFIELAASKSSSSGKPYLVRCTNTPPVESKKWLTEQLTDIRRSESRHGQ